MTVRLGRRWVTVATGFGDSGTGFEGGVRVGCLGQREGLPDDGPQAAGRSLRQRGGGVPPERRGYVPAETVHRDVALADLLGVERGEPSAGYAVGGEPAAGG